MHRTRFGGLIRAVTIQSSNYVPKDGMPTQRTNALGIEEARWRKKGRLQTTVRLLTSVMAWRNFHSPDYKVSI
jgi:hypothetical protein